MKNFLSQVAGFGLATTMALAVQSSAQAFDFTFRFTDGVNEATGTIFGLSEGVSSPSSVIVTSAAFGWIDEDVSSSGFGLPQQFTVSSGNIIEDTFTGVTGAGNEGIILDQDSSGGFSTQAFVAGGAPPTFFATGGVVEYSAVSATAVPFGVSGDLSILILGGLYGASRLRKTLTARKQMSNQEA